MKLRCQKVTHHTEEAECGHCGGPIYLGERVYWYPDDDGPSYCSRKCAAYHASDREHDSDGRGPAWEDIPL